MTKDKKIKTISEAPESNAGDDFHRLWAARKSLELLNFDDNSLKLVAIEGSEVDEAKEIDKTGEKLLSIDLAEYYGGSNFTEAIKVVFSQLKYSTRRADENFTIGKLCQGKKGLKGSIIEKLALAFKGYLDRYGRDFTLSKLKIKLVTNRPIQKNFEQKLDRIQSFLKNNPNQLKKFNLLKKFDKLSEYINKLHSTSNLSSGEFTDFLRVLDFTDCGTESRFYQKHLLVKAISDIDSYEIRNQHNALYMLINEKMHPEKRNDNSITIDDIIYTFNGGSINNLFPVPPKFEKLDYFINREQLKDIVQEIKNADSQFICLHGGAGVGKSTILNSIKNQLPQNSPIIIYDCYGQGSYLNSDELRHLPQNAFLQIINDISKEIGTSLLLARNAPDNLLPIEFKQRLITGIKIIRKYNPDAVLSIIIDAADNSTIAAENKSQSCFINYLTTLGELPDGCKILFTCRTSRIESLKLPENTKSITIKPFSLNETELFLKHYFPKATNEQVVEFHNLTDKTPRTQKYAIHNKTNIDDVFKFLKPYGKTVGTVIDEQINDAKKRFGDDNKIDSLLKLLIALPRPIPLDFIISIGLISKNELHDFCKDSISGLFINDGIITFKDEDFESHLREKYHIDVDYHEYLSEFFIQRSERDTYSATHLGNILFLASKYDILQEIVLENKFLNLLTDPFNQREVFITRTKLAIQSCINDQNNLNFLKLLIITAEAAKSEEILKNLVQNNVEILVRSNNLSTIQKLYFDITENIHYGASNWECAAIFSRDEGSKLYAEKHIIQAEKWVERRQRLIDNERDNLVITSHHLAAGAEAYLRLYGLVSTIKWLKRWEPKDILYHVIINLFNRLIINVDVKQIEEWITEIKRADVILILSTCLIKEGKDIPINLSSLLEKWHDIITRENIEIGLVLSEHLLILCEYLSNKKSNKKKLIQILNKIIPSPPKRDTRFYSGSYANNNDIQILDIFFRAKTLLAIHVGKDIALESFYSDELLSSIANNKSKTQYENSKETEIEKLYKNILPIYKERANVISGTKGEDIINNAAVKIDQIIRDWEFAHERFDFGDIVLFCIEKITDLCQYIDLKAQFLTKLKEYSNHDKVGKIKLNLLLANVAAKFPSCYPEVYKYLTEVDSLIIKSSHVSTEKVEFYESSLRIALKIGDLEEAKIYFDKATNVAANIDVEAQEQIRTLYEISSTFKSPLQKPQLAYEVARFTELSYEYLRGYDHFPWLSAIRCITNLDYNSALSTWCRWDHSDVGVDSNADFYFWSEMLSSAYYEKYLTIDQIYALSKFKQFDSQWLHLIELLLEEYVKSSQNKSQLFFLTLLKDLKIFTPVESRQAYIEKLIQLLEKHNIKSGIYYDEIMEMHRFFCQHELPENSASTYSYPNFKNNDNKTKKNTIFELIKNTHPSNINQINNAIKIISNNEGLPSGEVIELFDGLRDKCKPVDYVKHLNALLAIEKESISFYLYKEILNKCFDKWSFKQSIKKWKAESFNKVIEIYLVEFNIISNEYLDTSSLFELMKMFNSNEQILAETLKNIISSKVEMLSADTIYQSFQIFKYLIKEEQAEKLIKWILIKWNNEIPDQIAEGKWDAELEPQINKNRNFSEFLRFHLGHPHKFYRWRAAHAIIRLANFKDFEILDKIISDCNKQDCYPFQTKKNIFFWLSAKLWLFIVLDKIADLSPEILTKHFEFLKQEALNKRNAHVLIRFYAKSICVKLINYKKDIATEKTKNEIKNSLISPFKSIEEDQVRSFQFKNKKTIFNFDSLDTIPYWYSGLARVFGLSNIEITHLADKYILDYFQFKEDAREVNHVRADYEDTSNRHGSIPSVEVLRTYFEYHAMFFVANELLETKPMIKNDYWDDWNSWIKDWGLSNTEYWLSEYRDATPLEKRYFVFNKNHSPSWKWGITSEYLDNVTELNNLNGIDFITVNNNHVCYYDEDWENVSITSALVNINRSESLLRALQTAENFHDYKLPVEGENDFILNEAGFILKPIIGQKSSDVTGIDKTDPLALSLYNTVTYPCEEFIEWAQLVPTNYRKEYVLKENKLKTITILQNWSDYDEDKKQIYGKGSNGSLLKIKKDVLLSFLENSQMCLILECNITRRTKNNDYNIPDDYTKLYLIYPNGTIKTTKGYIEARETNNS